ncbi:DUF4231 domain-containing protein [Kitasatospora sp. SUK 42]|uniref:DUF4231 domain-containing protein n=1 Tax=Kitasatospora sp. SUK 42 TaxID=1588882 RepID=UPI0018CB6D01|nr:DUF4231 domain-containing protein [Kitasatospora sp. SUK 42]MBV2152440.1 DUF4231 domain-containing protein [Kitasatospora sp. SUK 42]
MASGAGRTGWVRERELLPEFFWAADTASLRGQHRSVLLSAWQLILLVVAAATGSADSEPWAWPAALAYLGAVALAVVISRQNPQGLWYEGRAAAESVKTLAWKFAVRADAYQPPPRALPDAEGLYRFQLGRVLGAFRSGPVAVPEGGIEVTPAMRDLRGQPLAVRREVYLNERIRVQHDWYRSKARYCARAGHWTGVLGVLLPALGLVLAVLRALNAFTYDALGTVSAVAASIAAWAQLRQYRPLAAAYGLAADELELIQRQLTELDLESEDAEEIWARLARDAEDAVSREHTTWQARREVRTTTDMEH